MWHLALAAVAVWAVWALTARALYWRWAAEAEGELSSGVLAATAMAFALLLPVALAVVLIHAGEPANWR